MDEFDWGNGVDREILGQNDEVVWCWELFKCISRNDQAAGSKLEMRKIVDEVVARIVMSFINSSSSLARSWERTMIAVISW